MRQSPGLIRGLPQRSKKKYRHHAELAGSYGAEALGDITYECQVGLWLNAHRIEHRRAIGVLTALSAVFSKSLPAELADAVSETEDAAKDMLAMDEARSKRESDHPEVDDGEEEYINDCSGCR